jgi:hypothetical protein
MLILEHLIHYISNFVPDTSATAPTTEPRVAVDHLHSSVKNLDDNLRMLHDIFMMLE